MKKFVFRMVARVETHRTDEFGFEIFQIMALVKPNLTLKEWYQSLEEPEQKDEKEKKEEKKDEKKTESKDKSDIPTK